MGRLIVLLCLLAPAMGWAQRVAPTFWNVEKLSQSPQESVRLVKPGSTEVVRTVTPAGMKRLLAIKERIEKQAAFPVSFSVSDFAMPNANALSTRTDKGAFVAVNFAMLDLMGDDDDALAAVIGHEYAHIALNHRDARQQREGARQGASILLGIALGLAGVPMAGTLSSLGTTAVARTFSRDEERDADEKGMRYAAAAGFASAGGIRAWERMASRNRAGPLPFLATHPASEERIENMRALAKTLPLYATVPETDGITLAEGMQD